MFISRDPSNFTNKKRDDKISRTLEQWFSNKIIIIKTEKKTIDIKIVGGSQIT